MRIPLVCGVMLCLVAGGAAADDVYEPHALLYYQMSFSGNAQDRKSSYGLRLDQTYHARNEVPDFRQLLTRPALAEFRVDGEGLRYLNIAGTDVGRAYRVYRANGEEATTEAAAEAPAEGEPAAETTAEAPAAEPAAETTAEAPAEEDSEEEEGRSLGDYLDEVPAGYLIGIGLGIVLLTGLGA
jgi:hypothetical protein